MSIQQNHAQQIPVRNFRVNYNGGFALLQSTALLGWLLNNNGGVHVVEAPNVEQAYFDACNQFVREEWRKNPYQQPLLPRFADVIRLPYHTPGFVAQIPTHRLFASVSRDYIGIYDTVEGAVEFVEHFKPSRVERILLSGRGKIVA
ncbi:MAG: hypothetical protein IJ685_01190 [Selenomonadaceae bacterium]|nr:hypothetical protein [Selenomonadaceae bacterium]